MKSEEGVASVAYGEEERSDVDLRGRKETKTGHSQNLPSHCHVKL